MAKENISNYRFMDMNQIIAKLRLLAQRNPYDNSFLLINLTHYGGPDSEIVHHGDHEALGSLLNDHQDLIVSDDTQRIILELALSILSKDSDELTEFLSRLKS